MLMDAFEEFNKIDTTREDRLLSPAHTEPNLSLNPLAVETSLNQAADLLDRILANRATFETLAVKEYLQLKETEIAKRRRDDILTLLESKSYENRLERLKQEYKNSNEEISELETQRGMLTARIGTRDASSRRNRYEAASMEAAYNGIRVPYIWSGNRQSYNYQTTKGYFSSTNMPVDDYVLLLAKEKAEYQTWNDVRQLAFAEKIKDGEVNRAIARKNSLQLDIDNEEIRSPIEKSRLESERDKLDHFIKGQGAGNGSPLSHKTRLLGLKIRIKEDFSQALERMYSAEIGLKFLFNRSLKRPDNLGDGDTAAYFDRCLVWVRKQIQWLLRVQLNDQDILLPISVKQAGEHPEGYKFDKNTECKFSIVAEDQPTWRMARLKGISAFIVGWNTENGFFNIDVKPPAISTEIPEVQSNPPSVHLTTVTSYNANKLPTINGSLSLMNRPIYGDWSLEIKDLLSVKQTDDNDVAAIADIIDIIVLIKLTKQDA